MQKITLDQFCNHWYRAKTQRPWHSMLAFNAHEFATKAGGHALGSFRESFVKGGFYGSGQKWQPRTSKWGKKFKHPVMVDTQTLKRSIQGGLGKGGEYSTFGKRDYQRKYRYSIWTTEVSQVIKGKRGRRKTRNQTYAAVHNTDPKFGLYTVNQYSTRRPVQRQFRGHSDKILDRINEVLVPQIFKGFPGMQQR